MPRSSGGSAVASQRSCDSLDQGELPRPRPQVLGPHFVPLPIVVPEERQSAGVTAAAIPVGRDARSGIRPRSWTPARPGHPRRATSASATVGTVGVVGIDVGIDQRLGQSTSHEEQASPRLLR